MDARQTDRVPSADGPIPTNLPSPEYFRNLEIYKLLVGVPWILHDFGGSRPDNMNMRIHEEGLNADQLVGLTELAKQSIFSILGLEPHRQFLIRGKDILSGDLNQISGLVGGGSLGDRLISDFASRRTAEVFRRDFKGAAMKQIFDDVVALPWAMGPEGEWCATLQPEVLINASVTKNLKALPSMEFFEDFGACGRLPLRSLNNEVAFIALSYLIEAIRPKVMAQMTKDLEWVATLSWKKEGGTFVLHLKDIQRKQEERLVRLPFFSGPQGMPSVYSVSANSGSKRLWDFLSAKARKL